MGREYRAGPHIRRGKIRPHARLLAYAQRLGLARPDAEDLVQELYARLLRPTDEAARDWFRYRFGYLQRLAANARRRERRRAQVLEQRTPVAPVYPGHEARLLARLTAAKILDRLPPADAELLKWRFLEDRSSRDIAERLQISEDAACVRLHRALTKACILMAAQGIH